MPFLNISNHPLEKWSPEQILDARKLGGGVIDTIPFPNVPPEATNFEVAEMGKSLVAMIIRDYPLSGEIFIEPRIAMVQGEFSLFWEVARRLLNLGWTVVVATSERKVVEVDGMKGVTFEFVQFREIWA